MAEPRILIRPATSGDVEALQVLIERAYRGASSAASWFHEGEVPSGQRISREALRDVLVRPASRLLVAVQGLATVGSALIEHARPDRCRIGLLSVDPDRQGLGFGNAMLTRAEAVATEAFAATSVEVEVLEHKHRLRGYYERRGYRDTAERRPYAQLSRSAAFVVYRKTMRLLADPTAERPAA